MTNVPTRKPRTLLIPLQVSGVGDLLPESAPLWAGDPSPVPTACGFSSLGRSLMPGASGQVLSPSHVLLEESQSREKDRHRAGKPTGPAHGPTQELRGLCGAESAPGPGATPRKLHLLQGRKSLNRPSTPKVGSRPWSSGQRWPALWDWLSGDPWDAGRRTAILG